jgi:hypothetical protein
MNRLFWLLGISLLLPGAASAQFGVRIGATSTTFQAPTSTTEQSARAGRQFGYQLGVFYEHPLAKRFSLVPELSYSRESLTLDASDYRFIEAGYAGSYRLTLAYVNVPVLLRATFGKWYLEAGPQASYLVGGREAGHEYWITIAGSYTQEADRAATDRYKRLDAGLCVGVGVKLPVGFSLGLRAYQGLRSLTPDNPEEPAYSGRLVRQTLQASLSYQLKPAS